MTAPDSVDARVSGGRGDGALGLAPEFGVPRALLDALHPPADRGGVLLGSGPADEPLVAALVRPAPTRLVAVGGLYLARQLALRALATGARVVVATGRPAAWQVLVRAAGDPPAGPGDPLVQVRPLAPAELPRAAEDAPLLVVHDGGAAPQELPGPRSAWQSTLYVLPYLHPQVQATADAADLVLLQRLPVGQAQLAGRIWRLPPSMAAHLPGLADDEVVALGPDLWQPLRLVTTPAERDVLGPVRRGD